MRNRAKLLERAENAKRESKYLDFKSEFNPNSSGSWCELIKDVVAFANSGGGIIVFGVSNDGSAAQSDCEPILALDVADVSNKIARYTDYEFSDIEIVEVRRGDMRLAALLISGAQVPIVFTKPGTYDVGDRKQKTAFSKGTIYFRHGVKSEPGNREDLTNWRDKEVENSAEHGSEAFERSSKLLLDMPLQLFRLP